MGFYDFEVLDAKGNTVSLADYRGKVLLVVNTATGCGFTPQYKGLQRLYDAYGEQGFSVLDFPCNQFGRQAPGTMEEITAFCEINYRVTFPQFAKIDVNGPAASPLFAYLKKKKGGVFGGRIKWNFTKFLIDRNGAVAARFGPSVTPEKIEESIRALL